MSHHVRRLLVCLSLAGCGAEGDWVVETWGEEYIEQQIPGEVFADGCSVTFDRFLVSMTTRALIDGDGEIAGEISQGQVYDLVVAGPTEMGRVAVPADHYSEVEIVVAPGASEAGSATDADVAELSAAGASVLTEGALSCGGEEKQFLWTFGESTTYRCEPPDLTIPSGGEDQSQITIHGDHLFYDGLENADAAVRGSAIADADSDLDGAVSLAELEAVSIPSLGYSVGEYSDVIDLRAFISHLSRTLVHIDGEGECLVDF